MHKQGPKRRRRTRRELPYGQASLWGKCDNFKQERLAKLLGVKHNHYKMER